MRVDDSGDQRFSEVQETVRRLEVATVLSQDFWRSHQHEHQSPLGLWQFLWWNDGMKLTKLLEFLMTAGVIRPVDGIDKVLVRQ